MENNFQRVKKSKWKIILILEQQFLFNYMYFYAAYLKYNYIYAIKYGFMQIDL